MAIISLENILKHLHSFALHNETEKKMGSFKSY